MSETSARYHEEDRNLRAINLFGQWQVQRHDGSKGTINYDPWHNVGHRLDTCPAWATEKSRPVEGNA